MRKADNLTTSMCWLSWNLGASTSWNTQGLSRLVMGMLYLYIWCQNDYGREEEVRIWKQSLLQRYCSPGKAGPILTPETSISTIHAKHYHWATLLNKMGTWSTESKNFQTSKLLQHRHVDSNTMLFEIYYWMHTDNLYCWLLFLAMWQLKFWF